MPVSIGTEVKGDSLAARAPLSQPKAREFVGLKPEKDGDSHHSIACVVMLPR